MSSNTYELLQIAGGNKPIIVTGDMEFNEAKRCTVSDISSEMLSKIVIPKLKLPYVTLIQARGERLPFPDASFDEVFIADFLGDPGIDRKFLNMKRALRLDEFARKKIKFPSDNLPEDHPTVLATLLQANRVLKPTGKLAILETLNPPSEDFMAAWLEATGFAGLEGSFITPRDPAWGREVRPYHKNIQRESNLHPDSFLAKVGKRIVGSVVGSTSINQPITC